MVAKRIRASRYLGKVILCSMLSFMLIVRGCFLQNVRLSMIEEFEKRLKR